MSEQPKVQRVGYVRVSSAQQNPARQFEAIGVVDRVFEDRESGASLRHRDQLEQMIAYVRTGDTVVAESMDRLGRDVDDLKQIITSLNEKGVTVELRKENLRFVADGSGTDRAMTMLMLHLLGGVAEFERARIRERQAEGIALAKQRGVYQKARKLSDAQVEQARNKVKAGVPKAHVARELGVSRQTLYTALNGTGNYAV